MKANMKPMVMQRAEKDKNDECVKASAMSKITALSEGMVVEFDSEEAEYAGLIEEDALSEEDAWESRFDPAD